MKIADMIKSEAEKGAANIAAIKKGIKMISDILNKTCIEIYYDLLKFSIKINYKLSNYFESYFRSISIVVIISSLSNGFVIKTSAPASSACWRVFSSP